MPIEMREANAPPTWSYISDEDLRQALAILDPTERSYAWQVGAEAIEAAALHFKLMVAVETAAYQLARVMRALGEVGPSQPNQLGAMQLMNVRAIQIVRELEWTSLEQETVGHA